MKAQNLKAHTQLLRLIVLRRREYLSQNPRSQQQNVGKFVGECLFYKKINVSFQDGNICEAFRERKGKKGSSTG